MTKDQAIKCIGKIQNGKFDRNEIVDQIPRGKVAIAKWNDTVFAYGMEYGAIMALMKAFGIKKSELH